MSSINCSHSILFINTPNCFKFPPCFIFNIKVCVFRAAQCQVYVADWRYIRITYTHQGEQRVTATEKWKRIKGVLLPRTRSIRYRQRWCVRRPRGRGLSGGRRGSRPRRATSSLRSLICSSALRLTAVKLAPN